MPIHFADAKVQLADVDAYLSAGRLLHVITTFEVLATLTMASLIDASPLKQTVLLTLFLLTLFTQLDARSRYQEFKQIRDQLIRYGPDQRIFRSVASSRCQRDAALAAARQLGYGRICKEWFYDAGYRWYHLLPGVLKYHPHLFFSGTFWRTTFFAPSYHSRYLTHIDEDALG